MKISLLIKTLSIIVTCFIFSYSATLAQSNQSTEHPVDMSFNGTFLSPIKGYEFKSVSENGIYKAKYEIGKVTDENRQLLHFELYKNDKLLYALPELPGADVYISNAGKLAVINMDFHFMQEVSILFYNSSGELMFNKQFKYASLFGFSPTGEKFVVGTDKSFRVISLDNQKTSYFPPCSKFAFSDDESYLATARESGLTVYQNEKETTSFNTGLFYPRGIAIDQENELVWIIGKSKLQVYSISGQKLIKEDVLSESHSFRDLKSINNKIYAGIHYKKDGISKGILRVYNPLGEVIFEETKATKSYKTFNQKDKPQKQQSSYTPIPWPFEPFDEVHKVWNHYEQHMGNGSGDWSYLHQGLDIEVPINEPTYAVEEGWVKLVLTLGGNAYWRVAVSPVQSSGYSDGWLYAHLVQSSIMVDVGDYVQVHDYLGDIIYWSADWGHIHFVNIRDHGEVWYYSDDEWGINFNPLLALNPITDDVAPVIENFSGNSKFGFCENETSNYLNAENLYGDVDIITKISDYHGDSEWEQPAFKTYYWLTKLPENNLVFPKTLGQILNHSYTMYNSSFYMDYAPLMYKKDNMHPSPHWMNINRDYWQILTNNNGDSIAEVSETALAFVTTNYTDGNYRLFVEAWDEFGNGAIDSMTVTFNNGIYTSTNFKEKDNPFLIYPNPCNDIIHLSSKRNFNSKSPISVKILDNQMKTISEYTELKLNEKNRTMTIDIESLAQGVYFVSVSREDEVYINKIIKL